MANTKLISSLRLHSIYSRTPSLKRHAKNTSVFSAGLRNHNNTSYKELQAKEMQRPGENREWGSSSDWEMQETNMSDDEGQATVREAGERSQKNEDCGMSDNLSPRCLERLFVRSRRLQISRLVIYSSIIEKGSEFISIVQTVEKFQLPSPEPTLAYHRDRKKSDTCYVLRPVLVSEPHLVLVQPVKEYMIKHWARLKPRRQSEFRELVRGGKQTGASTIKRRKDARTTLVYNGAMASTDSSLSDNRPSH